MELQLQKSPSNEYSGLISLRIDWFYLLAVQGALKSLCQHHSSKASILLHSAFFMVQLSAPYVTTGKTIALTIWIFVSKLMSLIFNTLSGFVIALSTLCIFCFLKMRQKSITKHRSRQEEPTLLFWSTSMFRFGVWITFAVISLSP